MVIAVRSIGELATLLFATNFCSRRFVIQRSKFLLAVFLGLLFLGGSTRLADAARQVEGDPFVDEVVAFEPGDLFEPEYGNPDAVLGEPDFDAEMGTSFMSTGIDGSITVAFMDNFAVNGVGPDILIFSDPASEELWTVEVSADGDSYTSFGIQPVNVELDLEQVRMSGYAPRTSDCTAASFRL